MTTLNNLARNLIIKIVSWFSNLGVIGKNLLLFFAYYLTILGFGFNGIGELYIIIPFAFFHAFILLVISIIKFINQHDQGIKTNASKYLFTSVIIFILGAGAIYGTYIILMLIVAMGGAV